MAGVKSESARECDSRKMPLSGVCGALAATGSWRAVCVLAVAANVGFAVVTASLALGVAIEEAGAVAGLVGVIGSEASKLDRWSRSSANLEALDSELLEEGVVLVEIADPETGEADVLGAALADVAFLAGDCDGSGKPIDNLGAASFEEEGARLVEDGVFDGVVADFAAAGKGFALCGAGLASALLAVSVKSRFLALVAAFGVVGAEECAGVLCVCFVVELPASGLAGKGEEEIADRGAGDAGGNTTQA